MAAEFRQLPDLEIADYHAALPLGPPDLKHGVLPNGIRYYVKTCAKPQKRAALALAVKIGSAVEQDDEQGVAHIVEHLAFNATEKYANHDLIKYLESIGAEFGACQNAYTSADDTVYEFMVPTDDENLQILDRSFDVFAEFATKIRCSTEDLDNERGAVMEEWRSGKDSRGRVAEAQWKLIMQGTKYAERLPIGKEDIIQGIPASKVLAFYKRWYRPENMAVIAVGDFADPQAVVGMIEHHMAKCQASGDKRKTDPQAPRLSAFVDKEQQHANIHITFNHPRGQISTPAAFVNFLQDGMFQAAVNNRFYKLSRKPDPPFWVGQVATEQVTKTIEGYILAATLGEGGITRAMQALLVEMARIRLHGFSEKEVRKACTSMMSDVESAYIERDQDYSQDLRDEYVRHFQNQDFVVGRKYEAQLSKTLLPRISAADLQKLADRFKPSSSCTVKAISHNRSVSTDELQRVIAEVQRQEAAGAIEPLPEDDTPTRILETDPQPGQIVDRKEYPVFGATELKLSNGMRVCYKKTDFLGDQVLLTAFAPGGLTEVEEADFKTYSMANTLAQELGPFGFKPEVLADLLTGKRVQLSICRAQALQAIKSHPTQKTWQTVMLYMRESLIAQIRNPATSFLKRSRAINYGNCYYFQMPELGDLDTLNVDAACDHFNTCYKDPAEFTICLTGQIEEDALLKLVERYLASIPRPSDAAPRTIASLTPLPVQFPQGVITEDVKCNMVMPQALAQVTFPVTLQWSLTQLQEPHWLQYVCQLLEMSLTRVMRFEQSKVYSVSVSPFFGVQAPGPSPQLCGDLGINFSCSPANTHHLIEAAVNEEEGPTEADVSSLRSIEQRSWENLQQENTYWQDMLASTYMSRSYQMIPDLDEVYQRRLKARDEVKPKPGSKGDEEQENQARRDEPDSPL
ncbi:MAG: chloroplast processing enzyme, partial [Trebouxia sp. A1-2]